MTALIGPRAASVLGVAALVLTMALPAPAQASFGIKSLSVTATNEDGSVDRRAGSHPYEYTVNVALNSKGTTVEGELRELIVELPPGMAGNPLAVPRCSGAAFEGQLPHCPGNTQIGVAHLLPNAAEVVTPVYNITPPLGTIARFGFSAFGLNSFEDAALRTGSDYGVNVADVTIPTSAQLGLRKISVTIWGVPPAESHDAERTCLKPDGHFFEGCSSDTLPAPFLTLPTSCTGPLTTTVKVSSLEEPDVVQEKSVPSLDEHGQPGGMVGCESPPFAPTITARPETALADSPTGLHVNLNVPQNEAPHAIATAHLRDTTITLPKGLVVNPSSANGLGACSEAQLGFTGAEGEAIYTTPGPANCPADSKLGTVKATSPALDHPVKGALYLAQPFANPFGSLIALYLTIDDPQSGIVVKLAGKAEPDPLTGQLKTTFLHNPQLPIEDIDIEIAGGPRATLTTPAACGTYTTTADLVPWSSPFAPDAFPSDSFPISSSPDGGCVGGEAQMPNSPDFEAGTVAPLAGAYSPFVLKLSRENGSQRIGAIDTTLPPGLTSRLVGLSQCSEAQIAQAAARNRPGQGATEQSSPSCPASAQFGTATVGAGSGAPLYVTGKAYLAGPYRGAPLSLLFITPAIAGPFDLGTVVVRAAAFVDPATAQITVHSDPIPSILDGIPLDVRSIAVNASRERFTLNPTSCDPMSIGATSISTLGQSAALANRFQVGGCNGLDYAPRLHTRLFGPTARGGHPRFRAVFEAKPGEANTRRLAVTLPRSEFLEQAHIRTICTRVQFNAGAGNGEGCPEGSRYGYAKAFTPLLDQPLTGPVFLRSSDHKLPDLLIALKGPASQPIAVNLVGRVDSVHGGIRNTIEAAPDAPVSKVILTMQGGEKGLLVNSRDICAKTYRSTVKAVGQNGKRSSSHPVMSNSRCSFPQHIKHPPGAGSRRPQLTQIDTAGGIGSRSAGFNQVRPGNPRRALLHKGD